MLKSLASLFATGDANDKTEAAHSTVDPDYLSWIPSLWKPGHHLNPTPSQLDVWHALQGLGGEILEFMEARESSRENADSRQLENLYLEAGDILYYACTLIRILTREEGLPDGTFKLKAYAESPTILLLAPQALWAVETAKKIIVNNRAFPSASDIADRLSDILTEVCLVIWQEDDSILESKDSTSLILKRIAAKNQAKLTARHQPQTRG